MNYVTLTFGLILGFLFVGVMVFKVLPVADQIVKRERGVVEAYALTRFCALCVGLPFYVFTIWMSVVILADSAPGISVLQEICGDDYECSSAFAMGRTNHDLSACTDINCSAADLLARSGSQPLDFPRLGLGESLDAFEAEITYSCIKRNATTGVCQSVEEIEGGSGNVCTCVETALLAGESVCGKYVGCDGDISSSVHTLTCNLEISGSCTAWTLSTDSAKQFSFEECACVGDSCDTYKCDVMRMEYYYPNVFYAGAATILFVLPSMIVFYTTVKTQLRKLIKCGDLKMYVYSQEAGMQEETTAENLVTGGFAQEQAQKSKYRTFSKKDAVMLVVGPAIIGFFSWMSVLVAGRVGLAFVGLSAGVILLSEIVSYYRSCQARSERMADRKARNNPHAERNYL